LIILKRPEEIEKIAVSGRIVGLAIQLAGERLRPGVTTREIDIWIEEFIRSQEATPSFKGYRGYPYASCISLNEEVVHGMPAKNRRIKEGDIVSIDVRLQRRLSRRRRQDLRNRRGFFRGEETDGDHLSSARQSDRAGYAKEAFRGRIACDTSLGRKTRIFRDQGLCGTRDR